MASPTPGDREYQLYKEVGWDGGRQKLRVLERKKVDPRDQDNYIQLLVERLEANEEAIEQS